MQVIAVVAAIDLEERHEEESSVAKEGVFRLLGMIPTAAEDAYRHMLGVGVGFAVKGGEDAGSGSDEGGGDFDDHLMLLAETR